MLGGVIIGAPFNNMVGGVIIGAPFNNTTGGSRELRGSVIGTAAALPCGICCADAPGAAAGWTGTLLSMRGAAGWREGLGVDGVGRGGAREISTRRHSDFQYSCQVVGDSRGSWNAQPISSPLRTLANKSLSLSHR